MATMVVTFTVYVSHGLAYWEGLVNWVRPQTLIMKKELTGIVMQADFGVNPTDMV